jgi:TetR/AcrR family transcriptional regulator
MSASPAAAIPARPSRGDATRSAILRAAEEIFASQGLAGARTEAIAAAAGVNKAMLFYYFENKEHLYEAVVRHHFEAFNREALKLLHSSGSASDILLRYVSLHFDFIASRVQYAGLYQQIMIAGGKSLERFVKDHFGGRAKALEQLLARGMRERQFRTAHPRHTAISITALIVFYFSAARILEHLGQADPYSRRNLALRKSEIIDFIRHGLFLEPAQP